MKMKQLQRIKEWAETMVEQYSWLTIKYEYSDFYRAVLVSFSPSEVIDNDEDFNRDVLAFEDTMTAEYGDDAPLFTDEEKLFTLSADALVIAKDGASFSGMEVDTTLSLISHIWSNWTGNSSYDQEVFSETEMTAPNNQESDILKAA